MPRKNTKNTQYKYVSFDQMLGQSFWELFHSNSKSAIWDKQQLSPSSYINWNEVSSLVDWSQLDLLEKKHFKLVDSQPLVNFVQYVGAFASVFLLLGSFSLRVALDEYIYSRNLSFEHAQANSYAAITAKTNEFNEVAVAQDIVVTQEVLGASTTDDTYDFGDTIWNEDSKAIFVESEPMVLAEPPYVEVSMVEMENVNVTSKDVGLMTESVPDTTAGPLTRSNLCSFSYGDTMYASGSTVKQSPVSKEICIKAPNSIRNISASLFGLGGVNNLSLNGSDCVKIGSKTDIDSSRLNVEMYDENHLKVGNCELVFASL